MIYLRRLAPLILLFCGNQVSAHVSAEEQGTNSSPYVHSVKIPEDASPEDIIALAANVVPNRPQTLYHQDEFAGFIHFGPNTFTGVEWGNGMEDPNVFNPGSTLDTDQWCQIMKAAGMRKVIITVKHHDGFCLWQTRYNSTFSVRAIPWRDGKGDVLRELSDSCAKHGLKLGVYLSPADLYQIETPNGLYGNESSYRESTIPTEPGAFREDPTRVRRDRPSGAPTFQIKADDYNRYFLNQLYELLTEYGPIHEVWFDGAHPKRKGGQQYVKDQWFQMVRKLAPDAAIFGGPDLRWCGNEGGYTRASEWSVLPIQDQKTSGEDRPDAAPGSREALLSESYEVYGKHYDRNRLQYIVCEVNTSIRAGWFWRNEHEQSIRTADDVFDIYERAVGGNAGFLLNVPPNDRGLFSARDEACLREVGRRIRETYSADLAVGATVKADDGNVVSSLQDGDLATFWQPAGSEGALQIQLPTTKTLNRFIVQEAVATVGQRVKEHALDAWIGGDWQEVAKGTTIGHKKILRFPSISTDRLRIRIIDSRLQPSIAEFAAHYYRQPPPAVDIARNEQHAVVLSAASGGDDFKWNRRGARPKTPTVHTDVAIRYTLDGTEPTENSMLYERPIDLPDGGRLRARTFSKNQAGPIADVRLGISTEGWKVHSASSELADEHGAAMAFDGKPETYWQTAAGVNGREERHQIAIDLGRTIDVAGIRYLPSQDLELRDGMIAAGRVETSTDGSRWESAGRWSFGNLINDRGQRSHLFDQSRPARFVRVVVDATAEDRSFAGAAELEILAELNRQ